MVSVLSISLSFLFLNFGLSGKTIFYGNGSKGPYQLDDPLIFISTDSVYINDTLINSQNYTIDYNQGEITFTAVLPESIRVMVKYKKVPFAVNEKYFFPSESIPVQTESIIPNKKIIPVYQEPQDNSDLQFSGSKTISVGLGSKDGLGLEQATRIDIKGNLQGVNISTVLSDVGNPIPPEGTTRELSEFDKIQIKFETDKFKGTYGDNDLIQPIGNLGAVNKKVIGVFLERIADSQVPEIFAGYAKSKGIYKKVVFIGQDNKQGPYYLTQGLASASIVPGTENVFVQGEKMVRGLSEDYSIDYSLGLITFTNRQVITSFTRIEIDFEYTTEEYNRYLILAGSQWQINDGLKAQVGYYSEYDDKSQNLAHYLNDSDLNQLANAGGESSYVWLSGVRYTGAEHGDYIIENDYYVYAGQDSGDYDVQFTYLGTGQGSYDYDNTINGFRFTGTGLGKYIPKIRIQLPEQNRIYSANLSYQTQSGIGINLDGYASQKQTNLYSSTLKNNNDFSYHLQSSYSKDKIKFNYQRTQAGLKFFFPGIYSNIDFNYRWAGISQESLKILDEIDMEIKPINLLAFNGGAGWLKSRDNQSCQRLYLGGRVMPAQNYTIVKYDIEYLRDQLSRYSIILSPKYKMFYPGLEMFLETQNDTSQRYLIPSLLIKPNDEFSTRITYDWKERLNQIKKSNQIYKIESNWTRNNLTLVTTLGYQINKLNNTLENASFFGNLSSQFTLIQGLQVSTDYIEQQGETQTMDINYVWAGIGLGNYKRNPETGQFYFDPKGDYVQELVQSGVFIFSRTRNVKANWDFYRWQPISFDGYLSFIRENSSQDELQKTDSRQLNLSILPYEKSLSFRLINTYDFSRDNLYNAFASQTQTNNNRIEMNSQSIGNIPFKLSFDLNDNTRERLNLGIEQKRLEQVYTFSPVIGFNLNIKTEISHSRAQISEPLYYPDLGSFWLYKWKVALERNWDIDKSTNLNANIVLSRRTATVQTLPFDINLFEPIGITPEARLNLERIFQTGNQTFNQLILGINYTFIKYPQRTVEHNLSVKFQANF